MAALCLCVSPICFTITAVVGLVWCIKHKDLFIDEEGNPK